MPKVFQHRRRPVLTRASSSTSRIVRGCARRLGGRFGVRARGRVQIGAGQPEIDRRSLSGPARQTQHSVGLGRSPWTIERPKPGALARPLGREERLGGFGKRQLVHADACVSTLMRTYSAGRQPVRSRRSSRRWAEMPSVPPSGMASRAFTARFRSASSSWLASTRTGREIGRQVLRYPHAGTERPLKQLFHAGDQLGHIHRLGLELLTAGESQQALGQRRTPLRSLTRVVEQAPFSRIVRQALPEQVEAAQDRHQQIVEVVRHPAGELADGVHLLRLEQLGERLLPLAGALLDAVLQLVIEAVQLRCVEASSAAVRSATRRSSSAFSCSSCRVLRYSSAKTFTLARSTSGTTGTGT